MIGLQQQAMDYQNSGINYSNNEESKEMPENVMINKLSRTHLSKHPKSNSRPKSDRVLIQDEREVVETYKTGSVYTEEEISLLVKKLNSCHYGKPAPQFKLIKANRDLSRFIECHYCEIVKSSACPGFRISFKKNNDELFRLRKKTISHINEAHPK